MTDTYAFSVQWILTKDEASDLQNIIQNCREHKELLPEWFEQEAPEYAAIPEWLNHDSYHFRCKEPGHISDNEVLLEIYSEDDTVFPVCHALSAVLQHYGSKHFYTAQEMYSGGFAIVYGISAEGIMEINTDELEGLSKSEMEQIIAVLNSRDNYD